MEKYRSANMHPAIIAALVIAPIIEFWIVFALTYAAVQRYDGRKYGGRVKDALMFRLGSGFR
jgi:hypothetical protein